MRISAIAISCMLPLFAACGDDRGQAGDPCTTSAECADGLLCDTALSPPACAKTGGPRPDFAGVDLFGVDLAGADFSANMSADLSQQD